MRASRPGQRQVARPEEAERADGHWWRVERAWARVFEPAASAAGIGR